MKNMIPMGTPVLVDGNVEDEKRALESFQAREEEIEKKKIQVRKKLEFHLDRVEEKTRRLSKVWEELEFFKDPVGKELAMVRKKVDKANHELRSLGQSCKKKEKEYREAMEAFHNKKENQNKLKVTLAELVKESEKVRLKKLQELSNIIDPSD